MTFQTCIDEIKTAAGEGATDDDVLRLAEAVQLRADRMRRERVDLSEAELLRAAAEKLGAEARQAARIEARNRKLNLTKRVRRREFYETAPDPILGIEAKLVGVNTPFAGSRLSVDAQGHVLERKLVGGMMVELENAGLYEAVRSGVYDRDIAGELFELSREAGRPGVTGNKAALQAAEIVHKYQRLAAELQNKEGAWIGKYEGYVARTAHDPDRIRRAGFAAWRRGVLETLDAERTFEGVDNPSLFLRGVYDALVSGVHLTADGGRGFKDPAFTGPGNLAKRLSQGRVLHWKDAGAWMDYQAAFGGKSLIENILQSLTLAARNTALMREFGTNPRAEFEDDLRALAETWQSRDPDKAAEIRTKGKMLANRFDELDGRARTPVHRLAARIGAGVRVWNSMTKLGGVTLSAVTDVPLAAAELNYQGVGLLESYGNLVGALFQGRGAGEVREISDLLGAGMDGAVGHIAARFDGLDTPAGTLSKMANTFFRWTGLTYWTDTLRAAAERMMARHLGRLADTGFSELPEETRRLLAMFGISPMEWEAVRGVELATADGRAFLTPDAALKVSDAGLEPLVGAQLDDLRNRMLARLGSGAERLDSLEKRLERLQSVLARDVPTLADADRLEVAAAAEGWRRSAAAIDTLRQRIVAMRDELAPAGAVSDELTADGLAFIDAGHRRLYQYGKRLLAGEAPSPAARATLWEQFRGFVGDEAAPFARPEDVDALARAYADPDYLDPRDSGQVVDPDAGDTYLKREIAALRARLAPPQAVNAATNATLAALRREIGALSRDERKLAANTVRRLDRLLSRIPREQARRAEAEAAVARVKDEMVARIQELEALPERLAAESAAIRDQARGDLALKLHSYFADRGEYAVIQPGARERAILRQGTQAGTPEGEALRFIGQFKAFPVAVISKAWGRELYGGQRGWGRTAGIVHMMVATTVSGYLAMSLKDISKGRTPRDPTDPKTWGAAFVQGGGAGIYGDYLVGNYSRFGRSALASLAGPTFGQIDDLAELWNRARAGDDTAATALRFAVANMPYANLFYTRVALDYLVLYQIQEAMNPGFLRRFERRIKKQNNQDFMLRPSAVIAHGGGFR